MILRDTATLKHTTLPVSRPKPAEDWRIDHEAMDARLRERSRKAQDIANKVQLGILALAAVSLLIGAPIMTKNIALGFIASQGEAAR